MTVANVFQSLTIVAKISAELLDWLMTNQYWVSIKNTYQIELLLSLETYQVNQICTADTKWYDMFQIIFRRQGK